MRIARSRLYSSMTWADRPAVRPMMKMSFAASAGYSRSNRTPAIAPSTFSGDGVFRWKTRTRFRQHANEPDALASLAEVVSQSRARRRPGDPRGTCGAQNPAACLFVRCASSTTSLASSSLAIFVPLRSVEPFLDDDRNMPGRRLHVRRQWPGFQRRLQLPEPGDCRSRPRRAATAEGAPAAVIGNRDQDRIDRRRSPASGSRPFREGRRRRRSWRDASGGHASRRECAAAGRPHR